MFACLRQLSRWPEFAEFNRFKMPADSDDKFALRFRRNVVYFQANYLIIMLLFIAYVLIAVPVFFVGIVLVVGATYGVFFSPYSPLPLNVGGKPLTRLQTLSGFAGICLVILILFGGFRFILALCIGLLVIVAHAIMMNPTMKSKMEVALDDSTPAAQFTNKKDVGFSPPPPCRSLFHYCVIFALFCIFVFLIFVSC
jgi:PRA1 family protein 1